MFATTKMVCSVSGIKAQMKRWCKQPWSQKGRSDTHETIFLPAWQVFLIGQGSEMGKGSLRSWIRLSNIKNLKRQLRLSTVNTAKHSPGGASRANQSSKGRTFYWITSTAVVPLEFSLLTRVVFWGVCSL